MSSGRPEQSQCHPFPFFFVCVSPTRAPPSFCAELTHLTRQEGPSHGPTTDTLLLTTWLHVTGHAIGLLASWVRDFHKRFISLSLVGRHVWPAHNKSSSLWTLRIRIDLISVSLLLPSKTCAWLGCLLFYDCWLRCHSDQITLTGFDSIRF